MVATMRKYYWLTLCVAVIASSLTAHAQLKIKDAVWVHGGNKTTIRDLVFSPDSRYLASTFGDAAIPCTGA